MKSALLLLLAFSPALNLTGQNKYVGVWQDYEASSMTLNTDHSFHFTYRFDTINRWADGTWSVNNDTLFFTWVPIPDTTTQSKPGALAGAQWTMVPEQGNHFLPRMLYYCKNVLYFFNNETGTLETKRYRPLWSSKKKPAGFRRNINPGRNYISVE
jgi:hypothetical protein